MALVSITAKKGDNDATIGYDFGETLDEAVELFGEEVVFSGFRRTSVITAQAAIRRYLETGHSEEEVQSKMEEWKPGVSLVRVIDPVKAILSKADAMEDDDIEALIEKLRAKQA